jgi:beta-glucosidase
VLLIHIGVQDQAIMEIVSGASEPSALLPFQMPANMSTVEKQFEDVPRDMECYTDSEGNVYDFAFGMNWSGVINDNRVAAYR